jgi:hypothetical protein
VLADERLDFRFVDGHGQFSILEGLLGSGAGRRGIMRRAASRGKASYRGR